MSLLTRAQVAEKIGVCPTTIYRWETAGISPVTPKRLRRTGQLRYAEESVGTFLAWMNEVEDATFDTPESVAAGTAATA